MFWTPAACRMLLGCPARFSICSRFRTVHRATLSEPWSVTRRADGVVRGQTNGLVGRLSTFRSICSSGGIVALAVNDSLLRHAAEGDSL